MIRTIWNPSIVYTKFELDLKLEGWSDDPDERILYSLRELITNFWHILFPCGSNQVKLCVELDHIEWRNDFEGREVNEDGLKSLYQPITMLDKLRSLNCI